MSDPTRWRDADGDGPAGARELLWGARPSSRMPAAARARSAARVARIAAIPTTASLALLVSKALFAGASVGFVTIVAYRAVVPDPRPPPAVLAAPAAVSRPPAARPLAALASHAAPSAVAPAPPPPGPESSTTRTPPAATPVSAAAATAATPEDSLLREATLLERARSLLASDPHGALQEVRNHARAFHDGQLVAERELIAIDALCRLGNAEAARARGDALVHRFPGSVYEERVGRLLQRANAVP